MEGIGFRALLTPEELNAKVQSATGYYWGQFFNPQIRDNESLYYTNLQDSVKVLYGGIDSFTTTDRARQLNSLMMNIVSRQANQMACHSVVLDFQKNKSRRLLFTKVEKTMTPDANETAVRNQLQHLHLQLLGESLSTSSAELEESYQLLRELWQNRKSLGQTWAQAWPQENECNVPIEGWWDDPKHEQAMTDPASMLSAWSDMLVYFFNDYKFVHE